jgi:hypothetical protein
MKINWYWITSDAFTSIRRDFTVATLIRLAGDLDRPTATPVSGDMIALIRAGVR